MVFYSNATSKETITQIFQHSQ